MSERLDRAYARRWYTLGVLCLSLLIIVVDTTIVNVALPTFARDLHASSSGLQWIVDAYTLTFAALLLLAGAIADRYGRQRALATGLAVFGAGSLAAAFTQTTSELIAARAVMGIGGAFIMPATLSIITADHRPMALVRSAWSVNTLVMMDSVAGMMNAPPTPMSARAAMSSLVVWVNAAASDPAAKTTSPPASARCRPYRSAMAPASSSSAANVRV